MTPLSQLLRRLRNASKLRQRTGQLASLKRLGTIGVLVLSGHVIAMMGFEGLDWWTAIWLTVTTVTTVGYGLGDTRGCRPAGPGNAL